MMPDLAARIFAVRVLAMLAGRPTVNPFAACAFLSGPCVCRGRCEVYDLEHR